MTIEDNNRSYRQSSIDYFKKVRDAIYIWIFVLSYIALTIADIVIIVQNYEKVCDEPYIYWLVVVIVQNTIMLGIEIYKKKNGINSYDRDVANEYHTFSRIDNFFRIVELIVLIIGWFLYFNSSNCYKNMPKVHNLVFAHIILSTLSLTSELITTILILLCCLPIIQLILKCTVKKIELLNKLPLYEYQGDNIFNRQGEKDVLIIIENDGCCICMEENYKQKEHIRIFNCQHIFHQTCADTWLERNPTCPICRREIFDNKEHESLI